MQSKALTGALVLATSLLIAACGSSDNTTTPVAGSAAAAPTADATSMPGMDHSTTMTNDTTMDMSTHGTMAMGQGAPAAGLRVTVASSTYESGQNSDLSFTVVAENGSIVNDYEVEQTKELHLILVRSDLTGYQHLHPDRGADGTWTVPVTFSQGGTYRMVADFVPIIDGAATGRTSITTDLMVNGTGQDTPLPAPSTTAKVDGYTVEIAGDLTAASERELAFTIIDDSGKAVMLEPYLDAFGHLVAFAQGDLAYTHIHPNTAERDNGIVRFLGQVKAAGPHRLFLQFAAAGTVHTAEFSVDAM